MRLLLVLFCGVLTGTSAFGAAVRVTITNNSPTQGVFITPVFAGFHDNSFELFSSGSPASAELERVAEDGNLAPLLAAFGTTGGRVSAMLGGAPIAPGESFTQTLDLDVMGANQFLSIASMILPSNDYFIGNPMAFDLSQLGSAPGQSLEFNLGIVWDAGTEVNDFGTSAGNPTQSQLGLGDGQGGGNIGLDQNGVVTEVSGSPFSNFLNTPNGFTVGDLDFTNDALYPNGILSVRVSAVPEPSSFALLAIVGLMAAPTVRRQLKKRRAS